MEKKVLSSCAVFLAAASIAVAQPQSEYVQVLVPFDTTSFPGVGGAIWSAELRVRNSGDTAVNLFPEKCFFIGREFPCDTRIDVPARTSILLDVLPFTAAEQPGVFLYVPIARERDVQFDLRIRDLSRNADRVGTPVPVVRSRNYRSGRTAIINVPVGSDVRTNLRVYIPDRSSAMFRVRVLGERMDEVLFEREYVKAFPTDPPTPPLVPATFDFSDALSFAAGNEPRNLSVEIERIFPVNAPYWPMISVTSNSSHRVEILTPN